MGRALAVSVADVEELVLVYIGVLEAGTYEVNHVQFCKFLVEAKLLLATFGPVPSARVDRIKGNGEAAEIVERCTTQLAGEGV
jgi:hypothetical protein